MIDDSRCARAFSTTAPIRNITEVRLDKYIHEKYYLLLAREFVKTEAGSARYKKRWWKYQFTSKKKNRFNIQQETLRL